MAASLNDKITDVRNAARPNSARATGTRSVGGASLACDSLAGWPTASKVHFVTYVLDSNSDPVAGTQLDCYGIVSGNSITSFTVVDGTDTGNSVGDVVEMLPTAAWGQDLADVLTSTHNRSGGIKSGITIPSPILTTPTSTNGTLTTPTITSPVLSGTATGSLTSAILSNPYKFRVYRTGALTLVASSNTKITYDTKNYDTGSNFDIATNNRFTTPISGFYQFNAAVNANVAAGDLYNVALYKNGVLASVGAGTITATGTTTQTWTISDSMQLAATDYVEVFAFNGSGGGKAVTQGSPYTWFSGFLISAT